MNIIKNGYIRYLSVCYDNVILNYNDKLFNMISEIFYDDPHIIVSNEYEASNNLIDIIEPIQNLYQKYNFESV